MLLHQSVTKRSARMGGRAAWIQQRCAPELLKPIDVSLLEPTEKIPDRSASSVAVMNYVIRVLQVMICESSVFRHQLMLDSRFNSWRLVFAFLPGSRETPPTFFNVTWPRMAYVGHTPSTAGTFQKKSRKDSGKTPETLSERFLDFPSRVRLGCPKPYRSRHLRLPEHFQNYLPPSTAGGASFFRSGSGEGLPELVMEFPAVLGVFLNMAYREYSFVDSIAQGFA